MSLNKCTYRFLFLLASLFLISSRFSYAQNKSPVVNDITQLNPIEIQGLIRPTNTQQIVLAIKSNKGPISIGGGRYSMGGQTATEQALQIDMRGFDSVMHFSAVKKEITVQTGITWRKVQEFIDGSDLSVKIMQTYANFTVGGSLSVNVHGRYIGYGPIISSVKEIKMVLANGEIITANREVNSDIFYGAIGGYGGLGVITEATLSLTDNCKVKRTDRILNLNEYQSFFNSTIANDSLAVFHNADIYPKRYNKVRAVTYSRTLDDVTVPYRLKPLDTRYGVHQAVYKIISEYPGGKWLRQHLLDPLLFKGNPVEWRNYEASYDVSELEPKSRKRSTYVLQEYFVPENNFDSFYPLLTSILNRNKVNVMNISIRNAKKDPGSILAWANTDVFAFVIYYKQGTKQKDKEEVAKWTRQLVEASISCKGSYYLPYQIWATSQQFTAAYPNALTYLTLKKCIDPDYKFRNKLWDAYYK